MGDTGIALFVYKRPDHTRRVLDGLKKNHLEKLYIFADGPKPSDDRAKIKSTRDVVRSIDWCETELVERETNWGLAQNTRDGINQVFEHHDRLIMIEDDDVPTADFVSFIERCLDRYEDDDRVMSVTGYAPPINLPEDYPYDVYFTYRDTTWGWGTWKDAWDLYERRPDGIDQRMKEKPEVIRSETNKAGTDLFHILKNRLDGRNDSWSVWWAWAILQNNGVCVNPVESRIKNIGHDGTGTNCTTTDKYSVELREEDETVTFPPAVTVDEEINRRYNQFHETERTLPERIKRGVYGLLHGRE